MKLIIDIISAKGLPRINKRSRQTPSCLVQIDGIDKKFQTQASKNAINPEWNESFTFDKLSVKKYELVISVLSNNNIISWVSISIDQPEAGTEECEFPLRAEDSRLKGGEIKFKLTLEEEDANVVEEEEEELNDDNEDDERNEFVNDDIVDEPFDNQRTYSPHRTPDSKRIKKRIENDKGESVANQLAEKSAKEANKKYAAFLKSRAPLLLDNEKKAEKIRKEIEEENEGMEEEDE